MRKIVTFLVFVTLVLIGKGAFAFEPFVIKKIEVKGLKRISTAAVIRDLPIQVGQRIESSKTIEIIQTLFKTGFFKQVKLDRLGDTLIVTVRERPSIGELTITGIQQKKPIKKILKKFDLQLGRMFDQAKLTKAEREVEKYYLMNGRYGVKINTQIEKQDRNRVRLKMEIYEGDVARIKEIKIIGNQAFSDKTLLKELHTTQKTWLSWLTKSDRYAREKLEADLETIRSYYMDRGYVHFQIDSTQVSLSPDKKDLYIAIHVSEGDKYYFEGAQVSGDYQIDKKYIDAAIKPIEQGQVFSRKTLLDVKENVEKVMGNEGYYFAKVRPSPEIDEKTKSVHLTYFVEPGDKIYVRFIHIHGNHTTQDEVIRRELRQMEGAVISTAKVEVGKQLIERQGFAQEVNVTARPTGLKDQVDVDYAFEEQRLGQISAGVNFSPGHGFGVEASASQRNFFGTGKAGSIGFSKTRTTSAYNVGYYNPYYTADNVGFGMQAFYSKTNLSKVSGTSEYITDAYGGKTYWVIPLTEYEALSAGFGYTDRHLISIGSKTADEISSFINEKSDRLHELALLLGWTYNSLDKYIFPTEGLKQDLSSEWIVPGGKVEYYVVTYDIAYYYPLTKRYILKFSSALGYGNSYGATKILPFYRNFYAGGTETVRGFDERSLGPKDSLGSVFGGNTLVSGRTEFIFPNPIKPDIKSIRTALFLEGAQVYHNEKKSDPMKFGAGISLAWNSPLGAPLLFSLAWPINYKKGIDHKRVFSFTFSGIF